jgi:hypothetical protein
MGKNFPMRAARLRILGAGIVLGIAVLPVVAGWVGASKDATPAAHRTSVARESAVTVDGASAQDARSSAPELRRVESIGTVAVPFTIVLAGSVAIAAASRRRRPPDPVTARTLARAPPLRTAFAVAR